MGKTRDLFKKISNTKGTLHAKMGTIKDRNGMDLTEAEDIKKRWQEYTEELYKKELHNPDISHFHCIIIRDLIQVIPEYSSGFPYFLQFKSAFCNKAYMI